MTTPIFNPAFLAKYFTYTYDRGARRELTADVEAPQTAKPAVCECGSTACGSGAHSDWCPLYASQDGPATITIPLLRDDSGLWWIHTIDRSADLAHLSETVGGYPARTVDLAMLESPDARPGYTGIAPGCGVYIKVKP